MIGAMDVFILKEGPIPDTITSDIIVFDPLVYSTNDIIKKIYGQFQLISVNFEKLDPVNEWITINKKKKNTTR